MKAAFYEGYEKIRIGACVPAPPGPREVLLEVSRCAICDTDLQIFHGELDHRVRMPQVVGHEMAGTISLVGEEVTDWARGDRVTVRPLDHCGHCPACRAGHNHICHELNFIGVDSPGAMQGLWAVPARTLHHLPPDLSFSQGALMEPLAVACHDVRLACVEPGEFAVVQGGGPIGLLVALVARHAGARVALSEINPFRVKLATDLGIEAVNPRETDLVDFVNGRTRGAGADIVFEVSGSTEGAEMMTRLPRTRGRVVVVATYWQPPKVDLFRFFWRELNMIGARVYEPEDFDDAIALAASGALPLDRLITGTVPLDSAESGFREMERGGEVMKLLVACS